LQVTKKLERDLDKR